MMVCTAPMWTKQCNASLHFNTLLIDISDKNSFNSAISYGLTTAGARNATTFVYLDRSVCVKTERTVIIALQKQQQFDQTNLQHQYLPEILFNKCGMSVWYPSPPCLASRVG